MKRRIVLLYKDGTYRSVSIKNLASIDFTSTRLNTILIPLEDHPNLYFPLKPNLQYRSDRIRVDIEHRIFTFDYDEGIGEDISIAEFWRDCTNIIEFGNAIYNLYKFRGASISIIGSTVSGITTSFTSYPTRILVQFFNHREELVRKIDSKEMESLENLSSSFNGIPFDMVGNRTSHPQFASEERMNCLSDFIYTPDEIEVGANYISLRDEKHWEMVDVYSDLSENDYLMVKLSDFGCYYFIDMETFDHISQPQSLKNVIIYPVCCPLSTMEIDRFGGALKRSIKNRLKPTRMDKERWRLALKTGSFYNPIELELVAESGEDYLMYYSLFRVITNYLDYFITASYGSFEDCESISFSMFGDDQYILSKNEYSDDKLADIFLRMMNN